MAASIIVLLVGVAILLGILWVIFIGLPLALWPLGSLARAALVVIWSTLGWFAYTAVFPTEAFYLDHIRSMAGLVVPEGASFIYKEASYPSPTGDYSACALIRIPDTEWDAISTHLGPEKSTDAQDYCCYSARMESPLKGPLTNYKPDPRRLALDEHIDIALSADERLLCVSWYIT